MGKCRSASFTSHCDPVSTLRSRYLEFLQSRIPFLAPSTFTKEYFLKVSVTFSHCARSSMKAARTAKFHYPAFSKFKQIKKKFHSIATQPLFFEKKESCLIESDALLLIYSSAVAYAVHLDGKHHLTRHGLRRINLPE